MSDNPYWDEMQKQLGEDRINAYGPDKYVIGALQKVVKSIAHIEDSIDTLRIQLRSLIKNPKNKLTEW